MTEDFSVTSIYIIGVLIVVVGIGIGVELDRIATALTRVNALLNGLSGTVGHELYRKLQLEREKQETVQNASFIRMPNQCGPFTIADEEEGKRVEHPR
jgi:hypothetical protein